jgi:hypothetical protein
MMDRTCIECERLLQAYEYATQCQLIIEHNAAIETGLDVLLRKAAKRCQQAHKDLTDHEATHMTATAGASATG